MKLLVKKDYSAAKEVCKKIKEEFKDVDVYIDTCDEWVNIYASITEREK